MRTTHAASSLALSLALAALSLRGGEGAAWAQSQPAAEPPPEEADEEESSAFSDFISYKLFYPFCCQFFKKPCIGKRII